MKLHLLRIGIVLLLGLAMPGSAQVDGDLVTVKGEVVDLWCYLKEGSRGAEHKSCAIEAAKAGNPIGLVTETGAIYLLMSEKDRQPGKEELADKMSAEMAVTGRVYKRNGVTAIYFSKVEPVVRWKPASTDK